MEFTIYSDITDPECYGLNEQLIEFGLSGSERIKWCGVQQEPALATPMRALERRTQNRVDDEITEVKRRVSGIVMHLPKGRPNTKKALIAVASVMRQQPARAAAFRDGVFRSYWHDATDLSVMAELQKIADKSGVPRMISLDHPDADDIVDNWDLDWTTERLGGVPRVIRSDGKIMWGLKQTDEAKTFFQV